MIINAPFANKSLRYYLLLLLTSLLLILAMTSTETAFAQATPVEDVSIDSLQTAALNYKNDSSRAILWGLLGDFAENPLKANAAPSSLLGQIFFVFNVTMFVIGVAFMGYTVIMSIAVSAHEGEIMGKRMSSLWVPIRYGFGVLGMIPAFSGFSLAQGVMMFFAIIGIGLANLMTGAAIDSAANFEKIMAPPSAFKQGPTPYESFSPELGGALFSMNVCASATATYRKSSPIRRLTSNTDTAVYVNNNRAFVMGADKHCGIIDIVDDTGLFDSTLRSGGDLIDDVSTPLSYLKGKAGFRNNAVDYAEIKKVAKATAALKPKYLKELNIEIKKLSDKWYESNVAAKDGDTPMIYPLNEINAATFKIKEEHDKEMEKAFKGADLSRIKDDVRKRMKAGGWTGIGSWFSTFAEVSSAVQSAAAASHFEIIPPDHDNLNVDIGTRDVLINFYGQEQMAHERNTCWMVFDRNATGNCSPLQNSFMKGLGLILEGSGGDGMVNPIIAAKNVGDWMLNFVSLVAGTAIFVKWLDNADKKGNLTKGMGSGTAGKVAKKMTDGMSGSLASLLLTMSLILGITFAVYIPFVPFLTWFSGLVSYFASVLEGLVAAQVWAFSHLQTEGEGMGQRAERGYMFILNMLLRPGLMVLGFFFASGLLTLLATFFFNQFGTAMANVQGNTTTGPFIMFGLLVIVGLALLTLVQTLFNLVYEIPDRVIAWFGGGMEARMAKEMDRGIEQGADRSARWAGGSALGATMVGR